MVDLHDSFLILIRFYRLKDGDILDEKVFCNDYINLVHSMGVFLYDDLLCILSLRYQTIHIMQIRESGNLVLVRIIGAFCREDDELYLNSHVPVSMFSICMKNFDKRLVLIFLTNTLIIHFDNWFFIGMFTESVIIWCI